MLIHEEYNPTPNKTLSIDIDTDSEYIEWFIFNVETTSHDGGLRFGFEILKILAINIELYDHRYYDGI